MCSFFSTGLLWKGLKWGAYTQGPNGKIWTLEHAWLAKQIWGFRIPDHWRIWRKKWFVYFFGAQFLKPAHLLFSFVLCASPSSKTLISRINLSCNMYKRCCSSRWSTDHLVAFKTFLGNTVLWSLSQKLSYMYLGIAVVKAARKGLIINRVKQLRREPDSGLLFF